MSEQKISLKQTVKELLFLGFVVLPVKKNKKPFLEKWTDDNFTVSEERLFTYIDNGDQIGIITGKRSGITVIDIDFKSDGVFGTDPNTFPETYTVRTPSGALQKYYEYAPTISQSQKSLSLYPCVDIRNNGGQVVAPPSKAFYIKTFDDKTVKQIDANYSIVSGKITELAPFPVELFAEYIIKEKKEVKPFVSKGRPGDDFEETVTWDEILNPFGWRAGHTDRTGSLHWTRPQKKGEATSATTRNIEGRERLFVFSTNAKPFVPYAADKQNSYTKLTAYATLNHNGVFNTAITSLKKQGYGIKQPNKKTALILKNMEDIIPRPIKWLWEGKIAKGKVTLIAGNPGLGKSQISLAIAAKVSNGDPWVHTLEKRDPKQVIILSAEDDAEDTLVPRLTVCDSTQENIKILTAIKEVDKGIRGFNLSKDLQILRECFIQLGNVGCIIIDPISAYLGETDSHKNSEVRAILSQLSELASEFNVAVIAITHFNKSGNANAQMGVMGSLAFVAAARAAFMVAKDEEDEEGKRKYFIPMKNNLAEDTAGLMFSVETAIFQNKDDEEIKTSRVVWGEEVHKSADELMQTKKTGRPDMDKEEAKEFLNELLTENEEGVPCLEIFSRAKEAGITLSTLKRARVDMELISLPTGEKNYRMWKKIDF